MSIVTNPLNPKMQKAAFQSGNVKRLFAFPIKELYIMKIQIFDSWGNPPFQKIEVKHG